MSKFHRTTNRQIRPGRAALLGCTALPALALLAFPHAARAYDFTAGDLVVSISGNGAGTTPIPGNNPGVATQLPYGDNQASPITLQELSTTGGIVGQLVLPQTTVGANVAVSGEYGSSSEGLLQLSGDGHSLTIAGYGVNAATYNTGGAAVYGNAALAQSTSLTNQTATTPVARVAVDVTATGSVDSSTALFNVYNTNNPRSVATVNGSSFYLGGQGVSGDTTEGVFYAADGASSATAINTTYDVRTVEIANNTLYTSLDSKVGTGQNAEVAVVGTPGTLPTAASGLSILPNISTGSPKSVNHTLPDGGVVSVAGGKGNSVNNSSGTGIQLSPEEYFFANATTLYIADGGNPKAGGLGDGGLQKWSFVGSSWVLDYTLSTGLNLVADTATAGTTGLIGLTGEVVGNSVDLFATNSTIGDLDQTYLYSIDDTLADTVNPGNEAFTVLDTAAPDTNIRGVSFAPVAAAQPVPEPASLSLLAAALLGLGLVRRRR